MNEKFFWAMIFSRGYPCHTKSRSRGYLFYFHPIKSSLGITLAYGSLRGRDNIQQRLTASSENTRSMRKFLIAATMTLTFRHVDSLNLILIESWGAAIHGLLSS
jgi:hypothetical protein